MKRVLPICNLSIPAKFMEIAHKIIIMICCVLSSAISNNSFANPTNAKNSPDAVTLTGTYTVGPGGDYLTLTDAIDDFNTKPLLGPVVFSLIANTYSVGETFPMIINANVGSSSINTLTIQPAAGINAAISGTVNSNAMFKVLASYVIINGSNNGTNSRNLSFTNNGSTSARTILFGSTGVSPVTNCIFKNCEVLGGSSTSNAVVLSDAAVVNSPGYFNNITIENNLVNKAFYGIYCNAVAGAGNGSGLLVNGNDLTSAGASAIQFSGIFVQGVDGAIVKYNKIGNFISTDGTTDCGIWLSTGTKNALLLNNTVTNLNYTGGAGFGSRGIYISTGVANSNIRVAGNMIANITGDGDDFTNSAVTLNNPSGILMVGPQTGIQLYHNSIYMGGVAGATNTLNKANAISTCIRIYGSGNADIRNNILVNNLGLAAMLGYGSIALMASNSSAQFPALNYNDYQVTPTGSGIAAFGMINNIPRTSLAAWKTATAKDAASLNVPPVFVSATNLHLVPSSNPLLSNVAVPIPGFNEDDIDNTTRSPLMNDIGCDEFVLPNTAYWVGKVSSDWLNSFNWEANEIPDTNTDVFVSGGYNFMPTIITTQAIRALNISAPVTAPIITISSGVLQIYGSINRTGGSIDGSDGTVEMLGSVAQTIPAAVFLNNNLKNLVVGNTDGITGVTIGGPLEIYRSLTFTAAGIKLSTNNNLVFKSTSSETAWLGNVTGKVITGNVTVERYLATGVPGPGTHGKSWQLLSVPVSSAQTVKASWQEGAVAPNANPKSGYGIQITGEMAGATSLGFDVYTAAGASMKVYNSSTDQFAGIANTNTLPVYNQKGYMVFVRGDRSIINYNQTAIPTTIRATGKLFTTGADLPPVTSVAANKFESVGNPYVSAIDFSRLDITGSVDNTFYVWDPLLPGYGGYQTVSATNAWMPLPAGTANYPAGVPLKTIQSGQAFFVHATGTAGTLSFSESAKVAGSANLFRNNTIGNGQFIRAALFTATDSLNILDANSIAFGNDYSNNYTGEDALKINNGAPLFSLACENKILAVEARLPAADNDTINYYFSNLRKQAYRLVLQANEFPASSPVAFFGDRFLNTTRVLDLSSDNLIEFAITDEPGSAASNRFYLVFKQLQVVPVTFTDIAAMRNKENNVDVSWKTTNEINVQHYEVERSADNRNFLSIYSINATGEAVAGAVYDLTDLQVPENTDVFYRIKSVDYDGKFQYSRQVKVAGIKKAGVISVYPNPVVNKTINISFAEQPEGLYKIKLINQLGQVVYSTDLQVTGNAFVKSLSLKSDIISGNYLLSITDAALVKETEQLFIP